MPHQSFARTVDVDPHCCAYVAIGLGRCHYAGSIAAYNTLGTDTWFCAGHDRCEDQKRGDELVEQSHRDVPRPDYSPEARKRAADAYALGQLLHGRTWGERTQSEIRDAYRQFLGRVKTRATPAAQTVARPLTLEQVQQLDRGITPERQPGEDLDW